MLLILDVDGVLTDGKKTYDVSGNVISKTFNDRDWTAIKQFKAAGWKVVFLSGDRCVNEAVAKNRNSPFYCNRPTKGEGPMRDKAEWVNIFTKEYKTSNFKMIYIGDDIFDINIMLSVGRSYCPSDAPWAVKEAATGVLQGKSGDNLISELWDTLKNDWSNYPELGQVTVDQVVAIDQHEKF